MEIRGKIALVTGGNRGLGLAYAKALLAAGAAKVYVTARHPEQVKLAGVTPIKLDVTDPTEAKAVAALAKDVDIVINNAGISLDNDSILEDVDDVDLRRQLDTNLYGIIYISRAFAPVLKANGGGVLVNMLSALSWASLPTSGAYSISKAAAWALTNGLRNELASQGTKVIAVHAGYIDTDMTSHVNSPKVSPDQVATKVIEGILNDQPEVLADDTSTYVKQSFTSPAPIYLQPAKA